MNVRVSEHHGVVFYSKVGDKLNSVQEMTANLQLSQSPDKADLSTQDSARLEACLRQLRDVIGEETASRQQLVEVRKTEGLGVFRQKYQKSEGNCLKCDFFQAGR